MTWFCGDRVPTAYHFKEDVPMKKFLALILALVMALSLVACGKTGTPDDSTAGETGEKTAETVKIVLLLPQAVRVAISITVAKMKAIIFFMSILL